MVKRLIIAAAILVIAGAGFYAIANRFYPLKYLEIIEKNAAEYGLPVELVCAVIHAESRFDAGAVSKKGARGLMQIAEITADWAAAELAIEDYDYDKAFDAEFNILIGCWYLARLGRQFGGVADTALAAYNAGSGNVSKWLGEKENSGDGVNLDNIPFGETRAYVKKVNGNTKIYGYILKLRRLRPGLFNRA